MPQDFLSLYASSQPGKPAVIDDRPDGTVIAWTYAELEARAGLAEKENLDIQYAPIARERLDLLLVMSLWGEGKHDEAKAGVERFCATTSSDEFIRNGRDLLQRNGLCH